MVRPPVTLVLDDTFLRMEGPLVLELDGHLYDLVTVVREGGISTFRFDPR